MSLLAPPHPGFLAVLASRRAYTTLLYLLLSMATGVFAVTFAVTGISLSLGLAILIIGVPVALLFLAGTRLLAVAEAHLLKLLVGDATSDAPALLPSGDGAGARLKALVKDRRTWTSLLYFGLHLPLGLAYFTTLVSLLSVSLGVLAMPVARLAQISGALDLELGGGTWAMGHPNLLAVLCGLAGLALIPLIFHLGLLLGRFQLWLAKHLLVNA